MNPKIALFLSVTLTAFVVATLSGVVNKVSSANAESATTPTQAAAVQQVATATEQPTDLPTPTAQPASLDPMQATTIASQAIGREDVYSVETSTYNGVDAYKVVFSSGDVVYVGLDSQVLSKSKLQPVVVNVPATSSPKTHKDKSGTQSNGNGGGESGGEHEHEGGDD